MCAEVGVVEQAYNPSTGNAETVSKHIHTHTPQPHQNYHQGKANINFHFRVKYF